jgi:methyltransferase (TIGR00027 family)
VREELARLPRPAHLVIVAAGLDTRALRLVSAHDGVEAIELDHPATQALKRERLKRLPAGQGVEPRLIPIDLSRDDLALHLSPTVPACVMLEGVSMYLARERFDALLRAFSTLPVGSSVLFDVLRADVLADPDAFAGARAQFDAVAARGEPYVSAFDSAELGARLTAHRLTLVDDLGADALAPGTRAMCGIFRLVRARVGA